MRPALPTAAKVLSAACLTALLGAGCFENDHHRRREDTRYEPRRDDRYDTRPPPVVYEPAPPPVVYQPAPPPVVVSGDRWYEDRRYDDERVFVRDTRERERRVGVARPRVAREVAIGMNTVGYRAATETRVYVEESEHDTVIWSGRLYPGETLEVVAKRNRIFVDRREVEKLPLKDNIRYRIFAERY